MTTKTPYHLVVDLGGTKIETILLDPRGDSLGRERITCENESRLAPHALTPYDHPSPGRSGHPAFFG